MRRRAIWTALLATCFLAVASCTDDGITYVTVEKTDTMQVDKITWVGAQVTWAGEVLNNDVQLRANNGWECTMVFTMPYWLPMDHTQIPGAGIAYALTMVEFYICTATDALAYYEPGKNMSLQGLSYLSLSLIPTAPVPDPFR